MSAPANGNGENALLSAPSIAADAPEIPWTVSQAIESWRRIMDATPGDKLCNFERAAGELLALADKHADDPVVRQVIVDDLQDMASLAGIDDDTAQAAMAARVNGAIAPNGKSGAPELPPTFPLTAFADIKLNTQERNYLVKGLLTSTGLVVVWGPPKSGKSFWIMDIALFIALGWEYRGRKVQQTNVVYIALEGRKGVPARVQAFKQRHNIQEAPFYLIQRPLDLITDAEALITSIRIQMGEERPGLVIIDTLNRSLVGSESKDEDMAAYMAAAGRLEEEFECLVIIVHHCGIDATRPRGHTSLTGAVEVQIAVKKTDDDTVVATVERAKDIEEGAEVFSRLEREVVGYDPDDDEISSLVVVPADDSPAHLARKGKRLSAANERALDALFEALLDFGTVPPASSHIPGQTRTTALVRWKAIFEAKNVCSSEKPDSRDKAFKRAAEKLQDLKIIGVWKGQVWATGQVGQART